MPFSAQTRLCSGSNFAKCSSLSSTCENSFFSPTPQFQHQIWKIINWVPADTWHSDSKCNSCSAFRNKHVNVRILKCSRFTSPQNNSWIISGSFIKWVQKIDSCINQVYKLVFTVTAANTFKVNYFLKFEFFSMKNSSIFLSNPIQIWYDNTHTEH